MRSAVVLNWEAAHPIPPGPHIRLEVTRKQLVWLDNAVASLAVAMDKERERTWNPIQRSTLGYGIRELLDLLKVLR